MVKNYFQDELAELREHPVQEFMDHDFVTIHQHASIADVIRAFEESSTQILPVVDNHGKFIGDVHVHDLLPFAIDQQNLNEHDVIGALGNSIDTEFFGDSVDDITKKHDITISPDEKLAEVALLMWRSDIRAIPVVQKDKLCGMITINSVLDLLMHKLKTKNKK